MARFELNILGCGSAAPTLLHNPTSQVLNVRDNLLMIDCGEGTQLAMRKARLKLSRLNHIFISHLHGDHCLGLIPLMSTLSLLQRTGTITVHTFSEGVELFRQMAKIFCNETSFNLQFNTISVNKACIYEDDAITVNTFPLLHRVPCVGYIVREKPKLRHINPETCKLHNIPQWAMHSLRQGHDYQGDGITIPNHVLTTEADPVTSYAFCSDTKYSKRVTAAVQGVDWLYHEATYDHSLSTLAAKRYHSTALQAAQVARDANVKHLIIGHYSKRYRSVKPLLTEAQSIFPATIAANEGMCIDLNQPLSD